ncbi:MAG: glycosyltransferase [Conexivisphaerales archaeon]
MQGIDEKHISVYDAYEKTGLISNIRRKIMMTTDSFLSSGTLLRKLADTEYDIIHYADPTIPPLTSRKIKVPQVVTVHDNPRMLLDTDLFFPNSFTGALIKEFIRNNLKKYKFFENVLANTNYVKDSLIEYGFTGKIETVYHPVKPYFRPIKDKNALRRELGLPEDKKLILSISTDAKRKNLILLERAMKHLSKEFMLVRVGKPMVNSFSFSNVSGEMLNKIYNACDLLVMPSIEEGLGLTVVEALATDLPVVASDIEVFHEIGGEALEFIDPTSVESLVSGIHNALEVSDDRKKMYKAIVAKFSYGIFRDKMLNYYDRLLG